MMRKCKLKLLVVLLLSNSYLFSQENLFYEKSFPAFADYFYNNYGIICKELTTCSNLNKYNVAWNVRNHPDKRAADLFGPILQSNDKECLFAYPCTSRTHDPQSQMISEIRTALGLFYSPGFSLNNNMAKVDYYKYVTVIKGKKTREMFNVDSVYIYDIPDGDSVVFRDDELEKLRKDKYPYCSGLVICKEGRFCMLMKLFFSEKGKMKEDEYIKMLSKQIWYEDK